MTSYRVHYRPSRRDGGDNGSLFIRIIHRRRYRDIPCHYRVGRDEWDPYERTIRLPDLNCERRIRLLEIKQSIRQDIARLQKITADLSVEGEFTVSDVCFRFRDSGRKDTVLTFTDLLVSELKANDQPRTALAYRSAGRKLTGFTGKDIPLGEITPCLIRSYEQYLFGCSLQMNTVSFYMRNLRAVYYRAVKAGIIEGRPVNPFADVFTGVHETKRRSLDREDINALASLDKVLSVEIQEFRQALGQGRCTRRHVPPGLPEYRRATALKDAMMYFMFSYHCRGMSFVDLAYLKKTEVGKETIVYKRKKTGFFMEVKITRPMRKILNHFNRTSGDSPYVFPIITPGKTNHRSQYETGLNRQNKMLKVLAARAGITRNLSTHVARHTWATMAKRMGYNISLISEGLGHRDTKVTSIYLASFERSALDELSTRLSRAVKAA